MDIFYHGSLVRLRNSVHGTYLHADEDGHGVSPGHLRATMNTAWTVHLLEDKGDAVRVLLNSAAYGRYLAVTNAPVAGGMRLEQHGSDHPDPGAVTWRTESPAEGSAHVVLHNDAAGCVLASAAATAAAARLWIVEPIPTTKFMPGLPQPTGIPLPNLAARRISYTWRRNADDTVVGSFEFAGRSVFRLRTELWRRLDRVIDVSELVPCIPTRYGQPVPLLVNLPRNGDHLTLVILVAGTPAYDELRFPDVDAP